MIQVAAYDPVAPSALAEWQADVDRVVPPSETLSGLLLRYEDGDPWRPINRLFLWQTWPLENTPLDLLVALRGPHPRSTGHYCGGNRSILKYRIICQRGLLDRVADITNADSAFPLRH